MEELQRNSSVNHGLVTEQDVEQKSKELRMLGETLTELKSESAALMTCCTSVVMEIEMLSLYGSSYSSRKHSLVFLVIVYLSI